MVETPYTHSEVYGLALEQLQGPRLDASVNAFNGFASQFGRPWLDQQFRGVRAPSLVSMVTQLWDDWSLVFPLNGSDQLAARWQHGFGTEGVQTEVRTVARLIRRGVSVELFPKTNGRVCDFRFCRTLEWVYAEVSGRAVSEVQKSTSSLLEAIASAAARAFPGQHAKVAIVGHGDPPAISRIQEWIRSTGGDCIGLEGYARFKLDGFDTAADSDDFFEVVPEPRLMAIMLANDEHGILSYKGTAAGTVADYAAERVFQTEAAQLPRTGPGILILDVSTVIDGLEQWAPFIQRRFQPNINTRVSAVVLIRHILKQDGLHSDGKVFVNPHAAEPLERFCLDDLHAVADGL